MQFIQKLAQCGFLFIFFICLFKYDSLGILWDRSHCIRVGKRVIYFLYLESTRIRGNTRSRKKDSQSVQINLKNSSKNKKSIITSKVLDKFTIKINTKTKVSYKIHNPNLNHKRNQNNLNNLKLRRIQFFRYSRKLFWLFCGYLWSLVYFTLSL